MIGVPALVGRGFTLNGSNDLTVNGYTGISGRFSTFNFLMDEKSMMLDRWVIGWGDAANRWDFGWNLTGPLVDTITRTRNREGLLWAMINGIMSPFHTSRILTLTKQCSLWTAT